MQFVILSEHEKSIKADISGDFDATGCLNIRPHLEALATNHGDCNVVLNLHGVNFMDSSGIGALVFLFKRLREQGGNLQLTHVQGQPQELMTLLRIDQAITIHWTTDAA